MTRRTGRTGPVEHVPDSDQFPTRPGGGGWPALPVELDLPGWRGVTLDDGSIVARHRDWPVVREVTVRAGAEQPWKVLGAKCLSAVMCAAHGRP